MQDTERYKKMIRQHMDLQMVQRRLDRGFYKGSTNKLFRDLLLLFNNAVVFFRNNSPENTAALQLRQFVTDQIIAARPKSMPPKSDPDRIRPGPRPDKAPAPPPPPLSIAVCQRRMEKKQQRQQQHSRLRSSNGDDNNKVLMEKKCVKKPVGVKEKVDLSRRSGSGTNKKDRNVITNHSGTNKKGRNVIKNHSEDDDDVDDVDDELEIRLRKRKNESLKNKNGTGSRPSGYLKRMKQKSPPKEVEDDSTDHKDGGDETSEEEEEENGREKRRKGGNGRSKRGRPPKRSPGTTDSAGKFGKRRREGRDPPAVTESGRARKRSRR